ALRRRHQRSRGLRLADDLVWRYSVIPNRSPVGSQPFANTKQQGGAVSQPKFVQHRSSSKGLIANNGRAMLILQRARDDFSGACRTMIDENDQFFVRRDPAR